VTASPSRDRVLQVDEHLQQVLEFMQESVPASKLVQIAEKLPEMARLLWSRYSQEPVVAVSLTEAAIVSVERTQSSSIV
jgi:hypothetical protein